MLFSEIITRFSKEHHDHTSKSGISGANLSVILSGVPPLPPLEPREDHPAVDYWAREDYNHAVESRSLGETNGDITGATRATPGHPQAGHSRHFYLQHHDGTQVNKREVAALSFKARSLWMTLKEQGKAPRTFGKMSSGAWEFFLRMMVTDPDFEFLRWCDDGEWKLREWAMQNYSSWTYNMGLRAKKNTQSKTEDDSTLNDSSLIRMSPSSFQDEGNGMIKTQTIVIMMLTWFSVHDGHDTCNSAQGVGEENPPLQTQSVRRLPLD